jgi:tRNA dimethylallyltransferase
LREGRAHSLSLAAIAGLNSAIKDFADVPPLASATSRFLPAACRDTPLARGPAAPHALVEPVGAGFDSPSLARPSPSRGKPGRTAAPSQERALVAIVGPTASGKSALALELAARLDGEIVNCDSVQIYRGFVIGAGKLPPDERRGIPHHLLDLADPGQVFTAGDYMREARQVLASIHARQKLPIVVGGTGLYLRALLLGLFEGPGRSEALRARLKRTAARRGREFLHRMLCRLDERAAGRIQPRDTQKIIRALEICILAGKPISRMHGGQRDALTGVRTLKIGLDPNRTELYARINARVERMFASGLLEETRALLEALGREARPGETPPALEALGYKQATATLSGKARLAEAIAETQQATRRYAKRQWTWFRREPGVVWFRGFGDDPRLRDQVLDWLGQASDLGVNGKPLAPPTRLPEGESA